MSLEVKPVRNAQAWHALAAEAVLQSVTSTAAGLSAIEAASRLKANGPNQLKEGKRISVLQMLLGQFKSVIIWVLIVAGTVAAALGEVIDAIAIFALIILNAAIALYQEFNAEKSIAALQKLTAPNTKVRRGGQLVSLPTSDIVVGDILVLEAGDIVAADARLLHSASLKCVEAALTGESKAVKKVPAVLPNGEVALGDRKNMIFMGTSIAAGTAQAVVVATAMNTELGHIAGLIDDASMDTTTPLQKKLDAVGKILVWAALGVIALLFGLGLFRGTPPLELFMTSISLAVAVVPEGLPAVVTVALSMGVMRMARSKALMRKLAAVETLGSTSVICTDKTGTLTVGEMTVRALWVADQSYQVTGEGYGPAGAVQVNGAVPGAAEAQLLKDLAAVLLGSNRTQVVEKAGQWTTLGDPTEGALLVAGTKAGTTRADLEKLMPEQGELPFDSTRKRGTVLRKTPDGNLRALVNGAPGIVLKLCTSWLTREGVRPLTDADREHILAQTSTMAKSALRVLAAARRDLPATPVTELTAETVERDLVFVGLSGMYDPPRPEAKIAVARCISAGVRVVMITGDHPETARAIAREIGISRTEHAPLTGIELQALTDEALRARVPTVDVYARVTAEDKLRIVRALKASGAVVAMTGDGVNDAPAIKGADIGIAMGIGGTEVTKQAADMIITDDNFATIVVAVEEGRGIYDNIRKTLQYLLAGNTGELLLMTACAVIGLPVPLLPIHLLWINLVTDGLPAFCLATDRIDVDVMKRAPRPRTEKITDGGFLRTMGFTGLITGGTAFVVYLYELRTSTPELARTAVFSVLVYAELLRSFGARSATRPVWKVSLWTNRNLLLVVGATIGFQILTHHNEWLERFFKTSPVSFGEGAVMLALGLIPLAALEAIKVIQNAVKRRSTVQATAGT